MSVSEHAIDLIPVEVDANLQALLDRFPLPASVPDADMNQEELAAALSQSVNTVAKWIRSEAMPVVQQGTNGRSYTLRLSHCYAWMRGREAERAERSAHNKAAAAAMQAELLGLDVADPGATLSPKERRELAEADLVWNKAALQRRQLVRVEDITELLEEVFTRMRDGIEAMPDRLEREISLSPEDVAAVVRIGRDILNGIADEIASSQMIDEDDIPDLPNGILMIS